MIPLAILCALVCGALGIGIIIGYKFHANRVSKDLRDLRHYRRNILCKSGGTSMVEGVTNYNLRSFDGGKNWYAVEVTSLGVRRDEVDGFCTSEFELKILGPADEVYPGLLEHITGMAELLAFVERNGPITLSGDNVDDQVRLLEGAGMTVTTR